MSDSPPLQELLETQRHFALPSVALVRKDWQVTRALRAVTAVQSDSFRIVFGGGTCLARAHKMVDRMSEDADLKIVPRSAIPLSGSQRRRQLGDLRDLATANLRAAGFTIDTENGSQVRSRDGNRYTVYRLPYAEPGARELQLRSFIQIELNFVPTRLPLVTLPVASFVAEAFKQAPEIAAVECVSVTETAAEKLVALTRRTAMILAGLNRGEPDDTLVRHIFDLHCTREHVDRAVVIELAREIARQDAEEFGNQYPAYREDIAGETRRALTYLGNDPIPKTQYAKFVDAMVYGTAPPYEDAVATVLALADEAWPL